MKYDHLKRSGVATSTIFKIYEIPTNVIDKNTKFTTKNVHIVTCGSLKYLFIYNISICEIHIFTVCTHFVQCIKNVKSSQYFRILFHVNESNA